MASALKLNQPAIALLSAAGDSATPTANNAGLPTQDVAGGSLIEYQIMSLARAGVRRFLIEVENVDGALLALADRSAERGQTIDFVRTGADIQKYVQPGDRIWVQSGALYLQYGVLEMLIKTPDNFLATLDGRDENAAFERIDLNTRWAGISIVGPDMIAALRDLPADWSIISSLLRQAVQAQIPFKPLPQKHVNDGALNIIRGPQDFAALNHQILHKRIRGVKGWVESRIFGPVSAYLAPIIWQNPIAARVTSLARPFLAACAAGLGMAGFAEAAIIVGIFALAFQNLQTAVSHEGDNSDWAQSVSILTTLMLLLALFGAAYMDTSYTNDGLFAAFAVAALVFIAHRQVLPSWASHVLQSPALVAILALAGTLAAGFTISLQWIMVAQLGVLLFVHWKYPNDGEKGEASLKRR